MSSGLPKYFLGQSAGYNDVVIFSPLPYRLAAIDLDGTLLNHEHRLSAGNARAVADVAARGVAVVLASGRRWATIAEFAREIGLPSESPIIAYNGAMARTLAGDTLFHQPLPPDPAAQIVAFCAAQGYHLNYYLHDELYVREETPWAQMYQRRTGTVPHVVHDLAKFRGEQPTKLLLIDTDAVTDRLWAQFAARFGDSLYVTKTEDEYLEFMAPGVNKGAALADVAARLGVRAEQCVAFGDSYNDLTMLAWVGLGVAMGNARPEVQAAAGRLAPMADEDGVATVLRELFFDQPT